jgi:hypothetical protein
MVFPCYSLLSYVRMYKILHKNHTHILEMSNEIETNKIGKIKMCQKKIKLLFNNLEILFYL